MKIQRVVVGMFVAQALFVGAAVASGAGHHEGKAVSLTGEVVDTGCYLAHGASGEKHAGCATKCIAGGMPMGLLTADGSLYLLTLNHDNADPYNKLKGMAAKKVTVTGVVFERAGMKGVDVSAVKLAAAK
jgi:hypothetical protein